MFITSPQSWKTKIHRSDHSYQNTEVLGVLNTGFRGNKPRSVGKSLDNLRAWSKGRKKGFPGGMVVKNLPANGGDARDVGSIPGSGRPPGEGNATCSSIPVWKITWTEEPGGPQSMRPQRVMTEHPQRKRELKK